MERRDQQKQTKMAKKIEQFHSFGGATTLYGP